MDFRGLSAVWQMHAYDIRGINVRGTWSTKNAKVYTLKQNIP